ncbi:MAG: hypothetical protein NT108_02805, partial [Candidatus Kaiserbacteria bacterium]|nr:hypothetical protein [Candidatus Kaiserbacteria bacterium]
GTTTPGYKLDTAGFINTDQYSGYKQAGNTVLYASTTNNTLAVGASAAAAWMSASSSLMPKSIAVGPGALAATPLNSIGMNTAVGYQALSSNTAGYFNTANGAQSLFSNTTGYYNTANGEIALYYNTTGIANTASGEQALLNNVTGSYNTGIGTNASLNNISATSSVAIGFSAANGTAAYSNQGGVYLGYQSGYSAATGSDYNTLLGYQSGYGVTTGARNVLIGQATIAASYNQVTTGSNNIAIGNDVAVASPTASNQLNIGNLIYGTGLNGTGSTLSSGNVGIGTTSPSTTLSVAGNGYFTGTVGIGGMDTLLARDAANTLAQRNGTNAQSLRVYSSYTDASNYSRLSLGRDVNNTPAVIITEQAGTGTAQPLYIGTSGAAAINFITNNTVAWALDSSGNFGPNSASLTYNLGSTGTKIKGIYTGNIYASSTLQATGNIIGYASVCKPPAISSATQASG